MATQSDNMWGILESHYYGGHGTAIKYTTRNICADSTARILEEMASILFPNEEIEIYVLPAQDGCHKDSFWIKNKDPIIVGVILAAATAVIAIPSTISGLMTDASTREVNVTQAELNRLQIELLKQETQQKKINISDEQYKKIVESPKIKKSRNAHFHQLQVDEEITKEKLVTKFDNKVIDEKVIESVNFCDFVETITDPIEEEIIEAIHEVTVVQPVNERKHKNLQWTFEDPNVKEKFFAHMADKAFYNQHLDNPFGLKKMIVRMKYRIQKDELGNEVIDKKEVIAVYKYNQTLRIPIPSGESITPAPLDITQNTNSSSLTSSQKNQCKQENLFSDLEENEL